MFPEQLESLKNSFHLPRYAVDLAKIEFALYKAKQINLPDPIVLTNVTTLTVNPTLSLIPVYHTNLTSLFLSDETEIDADILISEEICVAIWRDLKTGQPHCREADDADLLALKIAVENIDTRQAAIAGGVKNENITAVIRQAVSRGILLSPQTLIKRDSVLSEDDSPNLCNFLSSDTFTLQWHITQACDLHCKHCYDRSERSPLPYKKAMTILRDFKEFCQRMHVDGQVTFTGGNPLLYPHFMDTYRGAAEYGFSTAILGNPSPEQRLDKLLTIQNPAFFQISLEGLETHNDIIRGKGHFQRSLTFLDLLRARDIYSMVMLTLTRDNLDQILPLGELLRDRTDHFTFNRLSTVGEGSKLLMAEPEKFQQFLGEYEDATHHNPILGMKDNLFNIARFQNNTDLIGGCTGYGCGAAFNFVSLLPDGEVHACRKFPSCIGNILQDTLYDIYHSKLADRYRAGSNDCRNCTLNLVCRGCLAIAHSHGLDVFQDKDPFCFMPPENANDTYKAEDDLL